jgi:hypothetical protein
MTKFKQLITDSKQLKELQIIANAASLELCRNAIDSIQQFQQIEYSMLTNDNMLTISFLYGTEVIASLSYDIVLCNNYALKADIMNSKKTYVHIHMLRSCANIIHGHEFMQALSNISTQYSNNNDIEQYYIQRIEHLSNIVLFKDEVLQQFTADFQIAEDVAYYTHAHKYRIHSLRRSLVSIDISEFKDNAMQDEWVASTNIKKLELQNYLLNKHAIFASIFDAIDYNILCQQK